VLLPSLQVGGGDQVYNDTVFELSTLQPWLDIDDPHVSDAGYPVQVL
jgi:hypothetical protein